MKGLPIISLAQSPEENAIRVHSALSQFGFMYVSNHGVPPELVESIEKEAKRFFRLDGRKKATLAMRKAGKAWRGYFPFKGELTSGIPDLKEGIYYGVEHEDDHPEVLAGTPLHGKNQWSNPESKEVILAYLGHMERIGHQLMKVVAMGLGLEDDYFQTRYGNEPTRLFRIFNYPSSEDIEGWGVQEHTDMGFLTILRQDESGGLEVKPRGSVKWIAAPPVEGTFVINIGDMLELWTHGIYQATLHRVQNTAENDRLSFPFFFDPSWHSKLLPIESELLRKDELKAVPASSARKWDGTDLQQLSEESTYGEFVWEKVKDVFPSLL